MSTASPISYENTKGEEGTTALATGPTVRVRLLETLIRLERAPSTMMLPSSAQSSAAGPRHAGREDCLAEMACLGGKEDQPLPHPLWPSFSQAAHLTSVIGACLGVQCVNKLRLALTLLAMLRPCMR